jgi:acetyltransferase-like isoleucine patch superfamily enzyme
MKNTRAPKILDRLFHLFPLFFGGATLLIAFYNLTLAILFLYLAPPLLWRLLTIVYPQAGVGVSYLGKHSEHGNLWYCSHQLQWVFNAFAFLERLLQFVPGLYSVWLRLWGAKIGAKVNWTPECKLVDRPFIQIGDRCLIGNRSYFSAHIIKKREKRYLLWVAPVVIGNDCVISYAVTAGPGVCVDDGSFVAAGTGLYPKQHVHSESACEQV